MLFSSFEELLDISNEIPDIYKNLISIKKLTHGCQSLFQQADSSEDNVELAFFFNRRGIAVWHRILRFSVLNPTARFKSYYKECELLVEKATSKIEILKPKLEHAYSGKIIVKTPQSMKKIRKIHIDADLPRLFYELAISNTENNIETCGVLCGNLLKGVYIVTCLLIPEQHGTSTMCDTVDEDKIFEYQHANDLITLGWIHTHPTQNSFFSSVDLHTQFAYQVMLNEAVGIVITGKGEIGTYSLNSMGMNVIRACQLSGFHEHEGGLYSIASHVCWNQYIESNIKIVDLRAKIDK